MKYDIFKPWLTLDKWQVDYINESGNCFLQCDRQSGKTAGASIKFGDRAAKNPKQIILMLAYTEKQAYNLFFKTLMYLKACHPKQLITKGANKPTKHVIHLRNGSQIMCYAVGLTGEGIRTYTVTSLVIDEAAPMAREVFIALTPMISITKGTLDIISTPRGKKDRLGRETYFYKCSKDPNFKKFYVSAEDCPRHSKEFLESEKARMTKLEYAQEYLAQFLEEFRQFFPNELIKSVVSKDIVLPLERDNYLGVDVARMGKDETVLLSLTRSDNRLTMFDLKITKKTLLTDTVRLILNKDDQYNYRKIFIDTGGQGVGVYDPLLEHPKTKRKVVSIDNATKSIDLDRKRRILKEDLYFNLRNLMEKGLIKLQESEELIASLSSIQYEEDSQRIYGAYSHITEALVRTAWCMYSKQLNTSISWI